MPARAMKDRLAAIAAGSGKAPPAPCFFCLLTPDLQLGTMPNIATAEGQEALAPLVAEADLIVVDNIATLGRHGRENETESWAPIQAWLLGLRKAGKSVLLIHHSNKGGGQRGTSAREDILDSVIALRRPKDYQAEEGARFEVHFEKARGLYGAEASPFEASLSLNNGQASWHTQPLRDEENETILDLHKQGLSAREIAKRTGMHHATISRKIKAQADKN